MQDLEFRVPIAAIQTTRHYTGTVGLGGNGQFTRISALDTLAGVDGGPWRGTLLEDYELSLHLTLTGHRNEFTQDTYVDQEALPYFRRFVRQRTRWGQGTMQCGVYLRQLWTSPYVSVLGALEATYYLLQPWSCRSRAPSSTRSRSRCSSATGSPSPSPWKAGSWAAAG